MDSNASVLRVVLCRRCMHVENRHELQAYSKVTVCLRVYMNLFMNRDTDGTCKYALVSVCVNVYACILCACQHISAELATTSTNVVKNKWFHETKP